MEIIPAILTENMVKNIPSEFFERLAECSKDVVKYYIQQYLDNPQGDTEVKQKIAYAYSDVMDLESYLNSSETLEKVELIKNLNYEDINPGVELETLNMWKNAIEQILNNNNSVPYIAPIKGVLISTLRDDLHKFGKDEKNTCATELSKNLKMFSKYFRDSQFAGSSGTSVKKIIKYKSKYKVLLRGIDFMIEQKKVGNMPSSWRYL